VLFRSVLLDSYTRGVNAGLDDLGASPPEYLLLGTVPEPWSPADCVLVTITIQQTLTLSERPERMKNVMAEALPESLVRFLTPSTTRFDAPVLSDGAEVMAPMPSTSETGLVSRVAFGESMLEEPLEIGSNSWVVAPQRTGGGRAIVANDMHLGLMVPNTWHRIEIRTPELSLIGVSLPGVPGIVIGSNERIAWGFTNVMGDFQDLVRLAIDPGDPTRYRTREGFESFGTRKETIRIKGGEERTIEVRTTRWGPVVEPLHDGTPVALAWSALDPKTNNLGIFDLMRATSVDEALDAAAHWYGPSQNCVVADDAGDIGWTISGYLPAREGFSGDRSVDWSTAGVGWIRGEQQPRPRVKNPDCGYIATANARTLPVDQAEILGSNWAHPARQRRIRQLLDDADELDERDLLAIQLDTDVSLVFDPYRAALVEHLGASDGDPLRSRLLDIVEAWNGRADIEEAGMTVLDIFRRELHRTLILPLIAPCKEIDEGFKYGWFKSDEVLARLLEERPAALLPEGVESWDALIADAVESVLKMLDLENTDDVALAWGAHHRARIRHPLSIGVPALGVLLDAPSDSLPGHTRAVRAQGVAFGASERLIVSPGHEQDGILHMPTGQIAHVLSPNRMDMHGAWVRGDATPLLAGERVNRMTLKPRP